MSIDVSLLSDYIQIGLGVSALLGGVFGVWHKWVAIPNRKFKNDAIKAINEMQDSIKEMQRTFGDDIAQLQKNLEKADIDEEKEIAKLTEDFYEFKRDTVERINRVDSKNEKLLDMIIKYFSDNS